MDFEAFIDELEKISARKLAFGWQDLKKIQKLSKLKSMRVPLKSELSHMGPIAFPRQAVKATSDALAAAGSYTPEVVHSTKKLMGQVGGKALIPKGGSSRFIEQAGGIPQGVLEGKGRQALDVGLRAHEMDELALGARKIDMPFVQRFGHVSPDVILRERNRIVTAPKDIANPLTNALAPMREAGGESGLLERATRGVGGQGMEFHEGQRLSRHARKKVSQRMSALNKQDIAAGGPATMQERMEQMVTRARVRSPRRAG